MGEKLGQALGQQIVIDIRPGAGSVLGTDLAAKANPDGYTLVLVATAHALNPGLMSKLPYDAIRDFSPITLAVESPLVFLVPPSLGVGNLGELIALAKSQPGRITYGSAGQGTSGHLATELLKLKTGISMVHVPYKGAGQALTDLLGAQIQLLCTSTLPSLPHVRSGKLRGLAVTTRSRSRAAPEIPTVSESGIPGFRATTWYALLAPARTSPAIIKKLHGATVQALRSPAVTGQLVAQGAEPIANSPEELRTFLQTEIDVWTKVIEQAKIRPNT
ncbi:MAG: tripartite tricarboxylate transporter substrate binding protein [Betaproteobacteria bacterium]|nr:tripartite tricarboxylate transporter substrate binding protein [Betaproteobacteria bacterium]